MNTKVALLEEVKSKFLENIGIAITFSDNNSKTNNIATIHNERFIVDVWPEISQGNKGVVFQQLMEASREENLPVLLITKYIPAAIAESYVKEGVNFIDTSGNCKIRQGSLRLIVEGKKIERPPRTNQSRAFQEAGIRLIYCLLENPDNINKSFRELSELSQIALGSVSAIIQELVDLKFVLKTKNKRALKNKPALLQRWVIAYNDVLRPKLLIKRMSFINKTDYMNWQSLDLSSISGTTLWGGECAAHLITHHLTPANYTIYTEDTWPTIGKSFKMIPDEYGKIEILYIYNNVRARNAISPLSVYADLMGSGDSRNIETANIILNNELQYLNS